MKTTLKIKSMKVLFLTLIQLAVFSACNRAEAPDPSISVSLSSSTVKVGVPVTITIHQNTSNVTIYTGDSANNYMNSAAYLLAGMSEQDLTKSVYLPYDSLGVFQKIDFTSMSDPKLGGLGSVVTVNSSGTPIAKPNATLIVDTAKVGGNGKTVLSLAVSPRTTALNQGLQVYPNMLLRQNKLCVIRLRFSTSNLLFSIDKKATWNPITTSVVPNLNIATKITAAAIGAPITQTSLMSDALPTSIVPGSLTAIVPGQYYQDLSFDLSNFVIDWETYYKKSMGILTGIQFLFYGTTSAAFEGTVYVESVSVAGKTMAYDMGVNLPVLDGSGVLTYNHSFTKPGTYNVTVLGTSFGGKSYSGNGYQTNRGDNINATEYAVKYTNVTVPITVTP
jgi:hypothetical protein